MPGITFYCSFRANRFEKARPQTAATVPCDSEYLSEVLAEGPGFQIAADRYAEYPVRVLEGERYSIVLEGRVYGRTDGELENCLNELGSLIFDGEPAAGEITDWLLDADGDFVVFLIERVSGRIAVVNDVFSLIPVYYFASSSCVVVSRSIYHVLRLAGIERPDRMATAQYLLLGYSLGNRTLFKDVQRLEPACLVMVDTRAGRFSKEILFRFNFESKVHAVSSAQANACELANLFKEACRARYSGARQVVLSLSGGRDSRAVGSALSATGIPFACTSLLDAQQYAALDVSVAEKLAEAFGADWSLYRLGQPKGRDVLELLRAKGGQVFLGASYNSEYLRGIVHDYGRDAFMVTGNGGDKILPDNRPRRRIKSIKDLIEYIISTCAITAPEFACRLTELTQEEVQSELERTLTGYPEEEPQEKYVHFLFYERAFKRLLEGLDRQRSFLWATSPFWSVNFVKYAMNCPNKQKKNGYLYARFLKELCPEAVDIECARNSEKVPVSIRPTLLERVFWRADIARRLPRPIRFVRRRFGSSKAYERPSYGHCDALTGSLKRQIMDCSAIAECMDVEVLARIARDPQWYSGAVMSRVFTVTSAIEYASLGRSAISQYCDEVLDTREQF